MGFWIFMMSMNLLIPLTMIGLGRYFMKKPPKKINHFFGYRTTMSMKNKDTWEFAHKYFGKLCYKTGLVVLLVSVVAMLFLLGKDTETIGRLGAIICLFQCIPLIAIIFPTEKALKDKFGEDGIEDDN